MVIFYRQNYSQITLNIASNEELGVLDTGFVEDFNGVDGQLSLLHVATSTRYPVPVSAVPAVTPSIPNDQFRAILSLAGLPDGDYQLQGRVRDVIGNYTILGSFATPSGGERVLAVELRINPGFGSRYIIGGSSPLAVQGSLEVYAMRASRGNVNEVIKVNRIEQAIPAA